MKKRTINIFTGIITAFCFAMTIYFFHLDITYIVEIVSLNLTFSLALKEAITTFSICGSFSLLCTILGVIMLIKSNFVNLKIALKRKKEKMSAKKSARKQKRIEQLQAELNELKKDGE